MSKIALTDLENLENQTTAIAAINNNNTKIENAIDDTLSRSGIQPNQMNSNLDMNSNRILNLPQPISNYEPLRAIDRTSLNAGIPIVLSSLPVGGIGGQVLEKKSSSDFDVKWATVLGATQVTRISNIATLKTATPVVGDVVYVQGYAANGDGGGGTFIWDPTSTAPDSGINVQPNGGGTGRWVRQYTYLSPEMFGVIGVNAAGDTATWNAMATVTPDNSEIKADGTYLITGSITFTGKVNLRFDLRGAVFRQQTRFSQTLRLTSCGDVSILGGTFYGLGGVAGEFGSNSDIWPARNHSAGSYNGVAAIYAITCSSILIDSVNCYYHAGGSLGGYGTYDVTVQNCHLEGIGPDYIAVGENGSDFAIGFAQNEALLTDYIARFRFYNNRMFNHAFGIAGFLTKTFIAQGNDIGPLPGQHGFYLIDCNGVLIQNNNIRGCGEIGIKYSLELRAALGFNIPTWAAGTLIGPGDEVKSSNIIWDANPPSKAITNITVASPAVVTAAAHGYTTGQAVYLSEIRDSGFIELLGMASLNNKWYKVGTVTTDTFSLQDFTTSSNVSTVGFEAFSPGQGKASVKFVTGVTFESDYPARWIVSRKNNLEGLVITDNFIDDCLYGTQITGAAAVAHFNTIILGGLIANNVIRNSGGDAIKVERFYDGKIVDNIVDTSSACGINCKDCGVEISGNKLLRNGLGILAWFVWNSEILNNTIEDAGAVAYPRGGLSRHPILVANADTNAPPDADTSPDVLVRGNEIRWTSKIVSDCQEAVQMFFDTNYRVRLFDTTGTSKFPVSVLGTLVDCGNNYFAGFLAADQNYPAGVRKGNPYHQYYGAVRPNLETGSTKSYIQNDTCMNTVPTSGQPAYWYCTGGGVGVTSSWANGPLLP